MTDYSFPYLRTFISTFNFSFLLISWKLGTIDNISKFQSHCNLLWYIIQYDFPSHWNNSLGPLEGIAKHCISALVLNSPTEHGFDD